MEATAYSSDWRSCGWEWGLALGPLPLYVPLCLGRRPSGTTALPLVPKPRREKADGKKDLLLGGLVLGVVSAVSVGAMAALDGGKAAAAAAARLAGRSSSVPSASASFFAAHPVVRRMARAGLLGGALGATQFPLGRYWAETNLKGLRYYGTTASGAMPRQGREVIYRTSPLADPVTFVARLLTLQWSPVDYTIAADTEYYPLGWGNACERPNERIVFPKDRRAPRRFTR